MQTEIRLTLCILIYLDLFLLLLLHILRNIVWRNLNPIAPSKLLYLFFFFLFFFCP